MRISSSRRARLGAGLLGLTLLWACGSDSSNGSVTDPPPPPPDDPPVQTTSVSVNDNVFDPVAIQVATGATVTWNWGGNEPHNVTWSTGNLQNSPTQESGSYQATMPSSAGTLAYYCTIHGSPGAGMHGTIQVQ